MVGLISTSHPTHERRQNTAERPRFVVVPPLASIVINVSFHLTADILSGSVKIVGFIRESGQQPGVKILFTGC